MKFKVILMTVFLLNLKVLSQVSTPFNFGVANNYVGWDNNQGFPLNIKHEAAQPINFFTNAGAGTFNNQCMTIQPNGRVGIGTNFSNPFNLLDVRNGDINVGQGIAGNVQNSPQA